MTIEFLEIYAAHGDDLGQPGLGPVISYHRVQSEARLNAKGKGWYGGDGSVTKCDALIINGNETYLLKRREPIDLDGKKALKKLEIRKKALSKLTEEEKLVLGIVSE